MRIRFAILGTFVMAIACATPFAQAQTCTPFTDVAGTDTFCGDIQWLYNRGITDGCTASTYCPGQFVRRDQMARFMHRLGNMTFQQGGNGFGTTAVLGTTDAQPLELRTSGQPIARFGATPIFSIGFGLDANANQSRCFVFNGWAQGTADCFGWSNAARFTGENGLSIDYDTRAPAGNGSRWVHIGKQVPGRTIATWTGAYLSDAGVWTNVSDAAGKEAFNDVDRGALLDRLASLPIRSWRYKADPAGVRRIGPTAQDFAAAFGLGADDKTIATVDSDGVALAAIQGLNAKLEAKIVEKDAEIAELRRAVQALISRAGRVESGTSLH